MSITAKLKTLYSYNQEGQQYYIPAIKGRDAADPESQQLVETLISILTDIDNKLDDLSAQYDALQRRVIEVERVVSQIPN